MRVLIAGAGAVGGVIAGALAASGHPFVMMERDEETLRSLRENGLELLGDGDGARLGVEAFPPGQLQGSFDTVFLAVKGPRLGEAMRAVSPRMHRDTFFISLQAGWAVDKLAEMVEPQRVVWGAAEFAARRSRPGVIELQAPGPLVMGELAGDPSPRLRELRNLVEESCPGFISLTSNVVGRAWWTMRLSALLGPLGAVAGIGLEEGMPEALREPFAALEGELEEIMRLEGVEEEPAFRKGGPADMAAAAAAYSASFMDDLARGERLEREFTTGFLLERGRVHGMRTPALSALHSLLGELESGMKIPSPAALRELMRRAAEERELGLM